VQARVQIRFTDILLTHPELIKAFDVLSSVSQQHYDTMPVARSFEAPRFILKLLSKVLKPEHDLK